MKGLPRLFGWGAALVLCAHFAWACDRKPPESTRDAQSSVASTSTVVEDAPPEGARGGRDRAPSGGASAAASPTPPGERVPSFERSSFAGGSRVVAIGDLHGDFGATERVFRLAGAIDDAGHWAGGKLVVVQTGDQLDRGDDEAKILAFLDRLQREASEAGGRVIVLNGNHETMNVMGDFRYVTPDALDDFDEPPPSPWAKRVTGPAAARARSLLPGGGTALQLAERPLVVRVGKTLFAHGGVLPAHARYGIDRLNEETAAWMRGERRAPPPPVVDPDGPLWTRLYGEPTLSVHACKTLAETLRLLGAERLVVGHTVQQKGLSSACGERVYRIDVGLSAHYGDHPVQALELRGGQARVLTAE